MTGNLLTFISAIGACGLAAIALQDLLARRVRVLARVRRPGTDVPADDAS